MERLVMDRKASDNEYLHKDFHSAMSYAIEYLNNSYGAEAVREYLKNFTSTFYAPMISDLKSKGLVVLKEYFERIYKIEGGEVEISFNEDELTVKVNSCPAVTHLRSKEMPVAELFYESTKTVNEALCEGTPYKAELIGYDHTSGICVQRFYRRDIA